MSATDQLILATKKSMKCLTFIALLSLTSALHAQTPGVDCVPIQGQGWQGCAPVGNNSAPQSQWADHYGAIATDEPRGAMGAAINMPSKESAESAAMTDCKAKGGTNCTLQTWYRNECAVPVVGGKIFNVNLGTTSNEATEKGTRLCQTAANDCQIYYIACSLPVQVR